MDVVIIVSPINTLEDRVILAKSFAHKVLKVITTEERCFIYLPENTDEKLIKTTNNTEI